jgi:hypothetical protein
MQLAKATLRILKDDKSVEHRMAECGLVVDPFPLRRAHERGGFVFTLYVTHNREAAALADVQLVVKDGGAAFRFAPFQEAA